MKKTAVILLLLIMALPLLSGPKAVPISLNIKYKKAYMEAVVTRLENGLQSDMNVRIWKKGDDYRVEAATRTGPLLFIITGYTLYVVGGMSPSALAMDVMAPEAEVFLKKVFINTGKGRHPMSGLPPLTIAGKKCDGARYALLKNASGIYCRSELLEWREKKTMTLMRAETNTAPCEMGAGKGKISFPEVKETFEVTKLKNKWFMDSALFNLPQGCEVKVITGRRD